jgi:hypothetical protein
MSGSQMAGTSNDNTTGDDRRLASDELAFVTALVGAERVSEVMGLLFDDLAKGLIRWSCDDLGIDADFQTNPSLSSLFGEARGQAFFWRRDEDSRGEVDLLANRATWTGPLSGFRSDGRGKFRPVFNSYASTTLTASGIRFHHGDVVARLAARGLMSPAAPSSTPPREIAPAMSEEAVQEKTEEVAGASAVTPVLLPDNPTAILAALELNGFQQEAIAEGVLDIWGRNPPESLTPGQLRKRLRARHKVKVAEARARGDTPPDKPAEWDACNAFVTALCAWRAKQRALNS